MATITVKDLQDIAVKATSDFFNGSVPLNTTLAKEASDRGLNSEQVQRAVEATNTLTHLKMIELAGDRTSEFPVAEYKTIVKLASVPTSQVSFEDSVVEKTAALNDGSERKSFTLGELIPVLVKEAAHNEQALENAKLERIGVANSLLQKAAFLKNDAQIHEHLSVSSATDSQYSTLAKCLGVSEVRRDLPAGLFKSAAVNEVEILVGLLKRASDLSVEIAERQALHETWLKKKSLLKQAFMGNILTGGLATLAGKGAAKIGEKALGGSSWLGGAAASVAKAPFKLAGKAISATGRAAGRGVKATVTDAYRGLHNRVATSEWGQKRNMPLKPQSPKVSKGLKRTGVLATVGFGALDSTLYKPNFDPTNDESGNVWEALQN